jgi:hypothetical protein
MVSLISGLNCHPEPGIPMLGFTLAVCSWGKHRVRQDHQAILAVQGSRRLQIVLRFLECTF